MIIIGEKINGAIPVVAKAIAEKDAEFLKNRAVAQAEAGATFIDVHASVPEDVEAETLGWMLELVQEVTEVPMCVDSPSAKICAGALKDCKKEGLVNSVSMEGNKIDTIFPVIADTSWECVALLCDDKGIPKSADDRLRVFGEIMAKAKEYGIEPSRLHIDPLVEAIGTNPESFTMFSDCCKEIKAQYPDIHITSGLSNISFGLPSRKHMNMAFLAMAMAVGMDSAIMDPTNKDMIGIIRAAEALDAAGSYEACAAALEETKGFEKKHLDMVYLAKCKAAGEDCSIDVSYERDLVGVNYATDALTEEDEYCIEYIGAYRDDEFGVQK